MATPAWHGAAAALLLACALGGCASVNTPWPETVVRAEDMKPLTPMRTQVRYSTREVERGAASTVVLRLLVDAQGRTQRLAVFQSSGIAELDEAALHAARDARFAPYMKDGVAEAVTLVLPMHFPLRKREL
ncbi:energy transducer TonB [Pseudorhodoferax sp. Leaf267]|uniref:energy transducer TonB n=1 Tax=Pseudorhodoferax sp. Leaf267 TaxID=1736316 RepID=UPI0006FD33E5|nr:energy transducer TonB [Pseudorhodoferax sp. Leaf267]KQP11958.1 hypothetical protein ASF43_23735 [Pseudorhodoferax sp. Leaf267]